jgi:hypothetical protein
MRPSDRGRSICRRPGLGRPADDGARRRTASRTLRAWSTTPRHTRRRGSLPPPAIQSASAARRTSPTFVRWPPRHVRGAARRRRPGCPEHGAAGWRPRARRTRSATGRRSMPPEAHPGDETRTFRAHAAAPELVERHACRNVAVDVREACARHLNAHHRPERAAARQTQVRGGRACGASSLNASIPLWVALPASSRWAASARSAAAR